VSGPCPNLAVSGPMIRKVALEVAPAAEARIERCVVDPLGWVYDRKYGLPAMTKMDLLPSGSHDRIARSLSPYQRGRERID
jgi:hypothetical protein